MRKSLLTLLLAVLGTVSMLAQQTDMSQYMPKLQNGTPAPEIVLPTPDKSAVVRLSDFRGRYVIVDFWASWCGDCRREMPAFKRIADCYKDKVSVLSVSFDRTPEALSKYLADNPMEWQLVCDFSKWKESAVTKAYELGWIPTFFIIDPEGVIVGSGITGEGLADEMVRLFGKR